MSSAATATLADAQQAVHGIARSAYTGESLGSCDALMTSDSADEFVGRVSTPQSIAGHQSGILGRAAEARQRPGRARPDARATS